ncbi:unnamed protein product [Soboliphyme baturini]|uniref:Transposable element protein n=1 Tax=Soboliphyme baturini TaxID=241478 RepID=A0A183J2Y4_9BILA|nr:unnamed protein product [Soboliphyme baturini]
MNKLDTWSSETIRVVIGILKATQTSILAHNEPPHLWKGEQVRHIFQNTDKIHQLPIHGVLPQPPARRRKSRHPSWERATPLSFDEQCAFSFSYHYTQQINGKAVKQVENFKYLGVHGDEIWEEGIDQWVGIASGILRELGGTTMNNAELRLKIKLSVFTAIFISKLIYDHEL